MPTKGKCWSCGEIAFLNAEILENKETGEWYCMMVCCKCKRFYESGGEITAYNFQSAADKIREEYK